MLGGQKLLGSNKFHAPSKTPAPENFRWCRWAAERRVKRAQTRERGPHQCQQNFLYYFFCMLGLILNLQFADGADLYTNHSHHDDNKL